MEDRHYDILKKISGQLTWALVFLFIIMLNTCSVSDDVEDAIRDARRAERKADALEAIAALPTSEPAPVKKDAP